MLLEATGNELGESRDLLDGADWLVMCFLNVRSNLLPWLECQLIGL